VAIEHLVAQGSPEWIKARLGIPSASMFHQIVTPAKGELSKQSIKYAYKLVCERLLNVSTEPLEGVEWIERGKELEPVAANQYQFVQEVETRPAGFFTTNDGLLGASPDRVIIGKPAGLEIKCPAPWNHLAYLLDGPGTDYRPQVQGQLLVCEWDFVDFYSYNERMPAALVRTGRDEPYQRLMRSALAEFIERLAQMEQRARSLGAFQAAVEAETPVDVARSTELAGEVLDAFGIPP
jgi:YqaJ-like viral recombinase domain